MIVKLDDSISKLMKSQNHLLNHKSIVKELLENSLDSGATIIKIYLEEDQIKVEDNGTGIDFAVINGECDVECEVCISNSYYESNDKKIQDKFSNKELLHIGVEGYTSKQDMCDYLLYNKDTSRYTLGYKGQALSLINKISDMIIITSDGKNSYKRENNIIKYYPRDKGTTIIVKNLFNNCLLRKRLLNYRKLLNEIYSLVETYLPIHNVNILVDNGRFVNNKKGSDNPADFLKKKKNILYFKHVEYKNNNEIEKNNIDDNIYDSVINNKNILFYLIMGYDGYKTKDLQYIFHKNRPITSKKISKTINTSFSLFKAQFPIFTIILNNRIDLLSVDKKEVIVEAEQMICNKIKETIEKEFSKQIFIKENNIVKENKNICILKDKAVNVIENGHKEINDKESEEIPSKTLAIINNKDEKRTSEIEDNKYEEYENVNNEIEMINKKELLINQENVGSNIEQAKEVLNKPAIFKYYKKKISNLNRFINKAEKEYDGMLTPISESDFDFKQRKNEEITKKIKVHPSVDYKINTSNEKKYDEISVNYNEICKTSKIRCNVNLMFSHLDFLSMKIIGNFNCGFILCLFNEFLVVFDQHAASEITTFEKYKRAFCARKQKLLKDIPVDAKGYDEVLNYNGFVVKDNILTSVPVYNGEVMSIDDFYVLLSEIEENEGKKIIYSKIEQFMISKACRSSIMIGDAINHKIMKELIHGLAELEKPWKCPHGRPTFRILGKV